MFENGGKNYWKNKRLLAYPLLLVIIVAFGFGDRPFDPGYQWDLHAYYGSVKSYAEGGEPYAHAEFTYVYPPPTMFLFQWMAWISFKTIRNVFTIINAIVLVGLIYLWAEKILKCRNDPFFYIFCFGAYNTSILIALRSGNIELIINGILWLGFYFYLKGKTGLFCISTLAASMFKINLIALLVLLLFINDKRRGSYIMLSGLLFLAYLLSAYAMSPHLFSGYLDNIHEKAFGSERGAINPSTLEFVKDITVRLDKWTGLFHTESSRILAYLAVAAATIILSLYAYLRFSRRTRGDNRMLVLFFICIVYAIISPRFKDYSYMLIIPPTYYFIAQKKEYMNIATILLVLTFPPVSSGLATSTLLDGLGVYFPLFLAYSVWLMCIMEMTNASKD